jgi:hypothetical protein
MSASQRMTEFQRNWCLGILAQITKMPISEPFRKQPPPPDSQKAGEPVDPRTVETPDLETSRIKLITEEYESVIQWGLDIRRILWTGITNNPIGHPLFQMAVDLQEWFEKRFSQYPRNPNELWMMKMEKARKKCRSLLAKAPSMDPPPYDYVSKVDAADPV